MIKTDNELRMMKTFFFPFDTPYTDLLLCFVGRAQGVQSRCVQQIFVFFFLFLLAILLTLRGLL